MYQFRLQTYPAKYNPQVYHIFQWYSTNLYPNANYTDHDQAFLHICIHLTIPQWLTAVFLDLVAKSHHRQGTYMHAAVVVNYTSMVSAVKANIIC